MSDDDRELVVTWPSATLGTTPKGVKVLVLRFQIVPPGPNDPPQNVAYIHLSMREADIPALVHALNEALAPPSPSPRRDVN